ncbi:EF-hand domain-containing protein [Cereibacter changlensis]|nr:EF-hand domain-containing protein [Cereibacter changlensis]
MKRTTSFATLTLAIASAAAFSMPVFAQTAAPAEPPCAPGAACRMPEGAMPGAGPMGGPMGGPDRMDRGPMGGMGHMGAMFDFQALDADKDGRVTQAEVDAERQSRLDLLDGNDDGQVGAAELSAMFMQGMQARADARAARMVEQFDGNGDGQISAAEFAAGPRPMTLFQRMDTDKDGAISQAEADAAKQRMQGRKGDRPHGKRDGGKERPGRD